MSHPIGQRKLNKCARCSTCPQNPAHGIPTEPSCRVGRGSRTPCRSQSRGGQPPGFNGVWESVNFVSSPSMGGVQCSGGVVQGAVSSRRYLSTRASVLHTRPTRSTMPRTAPPASGSSTAPVNWSTRAVTPQPAWRPVIAEGVQKGSFYQALCYEISVPRRRQAADAGGASGSTAMR